VENRARKIEKREEESEKEKEGKGKANEKKRRERNERLHGRAMWLSVSRIEAKNTVFIFK